MSVAVIDEKTKEEVNPGKPPFPVPIKEYAEPEGYIDSSSDFEQMDRGIGWGIDDYPTYHRTEK